MAKFGAGHKKIGGRKKGSVNVATVAVKTALQQAFDELGGVGALVAWGKKEPGEFYRIWSKMLPTEIRNPDGESFRLGLVEQIVDAGHQEDGQTPPGAK
jgi:hypothetical protein